jgi:hypothetical protein
MLFHGGFQMERPRLSNKFKVSQILLNKVSFQYISSGYKIIPKLNKNKSPKGHILPKSNSWTSFALFLPSERFIHDIWRRSTLLNTLALFPSESLLNPVYFALAIRSTFIKQLR